MTVSRSSARFSGASDTKKRPSGNASHLSDAISTASRVLPMPPGPTNVNKRQEGSSSSAPSSSSSCDLPRNGSAVSGKWCILALLVVSERSLHLSIIREIGHLLMGCAPGASLSETQQRVSARSQGLEL